MDIDQARLRPQPIAGSVGLVMAGKPVTSQIAAIGRTEQTRRSEHDHKISGIG
jgi:hypothetical protein